MADCQLSGSHAVGVGAACVEGNSRAFSLLAPAKKTKSNPPQALYIEAPLPLRLNTEAIWLNKPSGLASRPATAMRANRRLGRPAGMAVSLGMDTSSTIHHPHGGEAHDV